MPLFKKISGPMSRLGLGPHVMSWLGSEVRVNASFQIFALTAGENVPGGEGGGNVRGNMSEGKMSYTGCL